MRLAIAIFLALLVAAQITLLLEHRKNAAKTAALIEHTASFTDSVDELTAARDLEQAESIKCAESLGFSYGLAVAENEVRSMLPTLKPCATLADNDKLAREGTSHCFNIDAINAMPGMADLRAYCAKKRRGTKETASATREAVPDQMPKRRRLRNGR